MINMHDFMNLVEFRITEGSEWFGNLGVPTYSLTYWNGLHDGFNVSIVFRTDNQVVVLAEVCDYARGRAYRLVHPDYKNHKYDDQAWDEVNWTDLDDDQDWLNKAQAITKGLDYDTRITVPITFSDQEMLAYMKAAHDMDITFNEFVEQVLTRAIEDRAR